MLINLVFAALFFPIRVLAVLVEEANAYLNDEPVHHTDDLIA